jgi:survival-of-motor-neuron-related-splicing factor 30
MQSLEELQSSLREYKDQLSLVEAHLKGSEDATSDDDERQELDKVRVDLLEVISLTEDLVKDALPPPSTQQSPEGSSRQKEKGDDADAAKASTSSVLPKELQENIRRNQAKAALLGTGPAKWAVGHRCEAFRVEQQQQQQTEGGGEWREATVRSLHESSGNYVVEFKSDGHMQEASVELVRPHREMLREEVYAPVAAPKRNQCAGAEDLAKTSGEKREVPTNLIIRPDDDERTRIKKKKILKSMKSKHRFAEMDRKQQSKKSDWQSFVKGKGSKKKKGFYTGRKRESIFKTSDDGQGRVGVVGSGKGLTNYKQTKRHEFELDDQEQD